MKKTQDKYKLLINKINLTNEETNNIKENILKTNKKINLKPYMFVTLTILMLFSCIITTSAVIKKYKIIENTETKKNITFYEKLNKEYNKELFNEKEVYKIDDIENKLELKILRNKLLKSNNYKLEKITINENKLAKLNFWLVNEGANIEKINFGFEINTKYSKEESPFAISGYSKLENYFIKNLNTEAIIIETTKSEYGPILCNFVYDKIIYSIELDKLYFKIEDLHKILDSFYI